MFILRPRFCTRSAVNLVPNHTGFYSAIPSAIIQVCLHRAAYATGIMVTYNLVTPIYISNTHESTSGTSVYSSTSLPPPIHVHV